jgi:hypothetical protein
MELRVQLLSGMNGPRKNCGDDNYPREIRAPKTQKGLDRLEEATNGCRSELSARSEGGHHDSLFGFGISDDGISLSCSDAYCWYLRRCSLAAEQTEKHDLNMKNCTYEVYLFRSETQWFVGTRMNFALKFLYILIQ